MTPLNTCTPPKRHKLTEFAVLLIQTGQELGVVSMQKHPDLWMDTVDRVLRGWRLVDLANYEGEDLTKWAFAQRLRHRDMPTVTQIRNLATTALFAWHARLEPDSVEAITRRMGLNDQRLRNACKAAVGTSPTTVRNWSVQDTLEAWMDVHSEDIQEAA